MNFKTHLHVYGRTNLPKDLCIKRNELQILKALLLERLRQAFFALFHHTIQHQPNNSSMECYAMDSKIIQFLIQDIIETGEYTLEGIAYHTHIPFDVIYDAACGISHQFYITPWAKIVGLYLQVKPDIANMLIDKLLEIKNQHQVNLSFLLES